MNRAWLRPTIVVVTLVASMSAAAETRFWRLADVRFNDGAVATGYIGYDEAAGTLVEWNVRVSSGRSSWPVAPFTYSAGNSVGIAFGDSFVFDSTFKGLSAAVGKDVYRSLWLARLAPLDGSVVTVGLRSDRGADAWRLDDEAPMYRAITAGSLMLMASPPSAVTAGVVEFYNAESRHYFLTADDAEKRDLDLGIHPGWVRTGESFEALATGSRSEGRVNPVCRYYQATAAAPATHFFSADADECVQVFWKYGASDWFLESDNVFEVALPDKTTGNCPGGTIPVYRVWNQRIDSNHRYTVKASVKAEMLAAGYVAEGYGPEGVAMCALR